MSLDFGEFSCFFSFNIVERRPSVLEKQQGVKKPVTKSFSVLFLAFGHVFSWARIVRVACACVFSFLFLFFVCLCVVCFLSRVFVAAQGEERLSRENRLWLPWFLGQEAVWRV